MSPEEYGLNPDKVVMCPVSGCWFWIGADSGNGRGGGYGKMTKDGVWWYVHRWVMTVVKGRKIPKNIQVDHKCSIRCCCNPDHLQTVTQSTNMKLAHARKSV